MMGLPSRSAPGEREREQQRGNKGGNRKQDNKKFIPYSGEVRSTINVTKTTGFVLQELFKGLFFTQ